MIADHGKNPSDSGATGAKKKADGLIISGRHLEAGEPRNFVLHMSQLHPHPTHGSEHNFWSPSNVHYGYYSDTILSKPVQHHKPIKGTKKLHCRSACCAAEGAARRRCPMTCKNFFCADSNCVPPNCDTDNCRVPWLVGRPHVYDMPPVATVRGVTTMTQELEEFSMTLKAGEFRPAIAGEEGEGSYWIACLTSEAYQLETDLEEYSLMKDYWVVNLDWLKYNGEKSQLIGGQPEQVRTYVRESSSVVSATVFIKISPLTVFEVASVGRRSRASWYLPPSEVKRIKQSMSSD